MWPSHRSFIMPILGLLYFLMDLSECANILAIVPTPYKSHDVVIEPLLHALATRGHNLTIYSSFPLSGPHPNISHFDTSKEIQPEISSFDFRVIRQLTSNKFSVFSTFISLSETYCENMFKVPTLKRTKDTKFDLMITEMFIDTCYVHFSHKLGVPLVSGLPDNPSYIPTCISNLQLKSTLYERVYNTLQVAFANIFYRVNGSPKYQKLAEEFFQEKLPWIEDVARTSSLLLVNRYPSLSYSRPLPPNVVEVGGIHIKPSKPLPQDIQEILDSTTQGVILFSFGSIINVSSIPEDKMRVIFNVFSTISQTVLLKYEGMLENAPKNVVTKKWLPQQDILEHKNVVALITHCGLASVMEAVYFGKPILGFPIFNDQFPNINYIASRGAGISLDLEDMTEGDFHQAVHQIIYNNSYTENMQKLMSQFRDRPQSALQAAVYWTEYVLRHRGAAHLQPVSVSLPQYQLWLLDVLAVLLAGLTASLYVIYKSFAVFLRYLRHHYHHKLKKSKLN